MKHEGHKRVTMEPRGSHATSNNIHPWGEPYPGQAWGKGRRAKSAAAGPLPGWLMATWPGWGVPRGPIGGRNADLNKRCT